MTTTTGNGIEKFVGLDTDIYREALQQGLAQQYEQDARELLMAEKAAKAPDLALRAFGIVLDIAANDDTEREVTEFVPGKTNLGKYLGLSALDRLISVRVSTDHKYTSGYEVDAIETEKGSQQPLIAVTASIRTDVVRRRASHSVRRRAQDSPSALRYGGPMVKQRHILNRFTLATEVTTEEGLDEPFWSDDFLNLSVQADRLATNFTFSQKLKIADRKPHSDKIWRDLDIAEATAELDKFVALVADMPHRPGTDAVRQIQDSL